MPEMIPKPKHLGPEYASQFADPAVVAAYHHRPPYAAAAFPRLRDLVIGQPRIVLDLGCGTGDIARPLAGVVDFVDAVDCSAAMIERGQSSFEQSFDSYIESIHSRNGFSRNRMTDQAAADFDAGVRRALVERCPDGTVHFDVVGRIIWGRPL